MAYNYKQQQTAAELAAALAIRLRTATTYGEVTDPVTIVGSGLAGSQSASIRIQDQRGSADAGWDNIAGYQQTVFTTGVAQILVENAGGLPADVFATNAVTFNAFVAADTVTIDGNVFTGRAAPANANEFLIGASNAATAANFAAVVNAHPIVGQMVTATPSNTAVASLVSKIPGGAGNRITLAISAHGSVTAATFANGAGRAGQRYVFDTVVAGNVVVIGGTSIASDAALQDETHWLADASDTVEATNAATAINANTTLNKYVKAYGFGPHVFVVANTAGVQGNFVTTTGTALRTVADAATLTGGAGGSLSPIISSSWLNTILLECGTRGLKVEYWAVPGGTAPVFANVGSAVLYGEFDTQPYWPLSGRV